MAISLNSVTRGVVKPPRILMFGTHGVGKTSLAASFPSPIFIQLEDGLGTLNAPSFGLLKTYDEVMEAIGALYSEEHEYKTIVLDSLDWLEPVVWTETARANGWVNIEQAGYGKGYIAASDNWRVLLDGLNALRDEKGMTIVMLAHSEVKQFHSPESDPYDRYIIKLHKAASALVQEHVDCVFFINYRVTTVKTDLGFNKKATRAVGGGQRVLYTEERPSFLAKNRYSMPDLIELPDDPTGGFATLSPHLPVVGA